MTTLSFANSILLNAAVAAVLATLVWMVAKIPCIRRRPGLRHCLWVIVLLKLVTPPLFEWSIPPNWFPSEPVQVTHPRAIPFSELSSVPISESSPFVESKFRTAIEPSVRWAFVAVLIAAMGTLGVLAIAMVQVWQLRRALRHGASNDERLNRIAVGAAKVMAVASPPSVCVVAANVSPLLWVRWTGPLIVLPRRLRDELTDEQLSCVVSHEIAHFLRRDHWTNLVSLLVAAVCWWNPVVWWVRRELRIAQEACCDALVISRAVASRRKYAETLFQALEFLQAELSLLPALASGFGNKSSTERRFEMIANPLVNHRLSWWSYPIVLCALAVLPCLPSFTQAQDQAEPSQVEDEMAAEMSADDARRTTDIELTAKLHAEYLYWAHAQSPTHTDRRVYKAQRSKLGIVVLAFERKSEKLAWSSEIELPADKKPIADQRFLLHTGGGIVTIAVFQKDGRLTIQELDAETGNVSGETQLDQSGQPSAVYWDLRLPLVQLGQAGPGFQALGIPPGHQNQIDWWYRYGLPEGPIEVGGHPRLPNFVEVVTGPADGIPPGQDLVVTRNWNQAGNTLILGLDTISPKWKRAGNDLVLELNIPTGADAKETAPLVRARIQFAVELWQRFNGNEPVEQITTSREDATIRIRVKGKAGKQQTNSDDPYNPETNETGPNSPSEDGEATQDGYDAGLPGASATTETERK